MVIGFLFSPIVTYTAKREAVKRFSLLTVLPAPKQTHICRNTQKENELNAFNNGKNTMDALIATVANVKKTLSMSVLTLTLENCHNRTCALVCLTIVTLMCGYFNIFLLFQLVCSAFITFNNKNS